MKTLILVLLGMLSLLTVEPVAAEQISHTIRCESEDFFPRTCELPVAPRGSEIREIRKVRQVSSKPCIEGRTWEANESGITVRNGCRADFMIVYRVSDRWRQKPDWRQRHDRHDDWHPNVPDRYTEDPTDIVIRAFEDVLNRRPARDEMRFYRSLIIDRGWTERQIRSDLRHRQQYGR